MNKKNFFLNTLAFYRGCKRPKRKPDYISVNQFGQVSSEYWYTDRGVIRCSNHWSNILSSKEVKAFTCGKVASCIWVLKNHSKSKGYSDIPCGFCRWEDFRFIQLFLIKENWQDAQNNKSQVSHSELCCLLEKLMRFYSPEIIK